MVEYYFFTASPNDIEIWQRKQGENWHDHNHQNIKYGKGNSQGRIV
jgi:hypothetical protein